MKKAAACLLLVLLSTSFVYGEVKIKKVSNPDGTYDYVFYSEGKEVARQVLEVTSRYLLGVGTDFNVIKTIGRVPDGVVKEYFNNGKLKGELSYRDNKPEGICKGYYKNGNLSYETTYKNGRRDGVTKYYYNTVVVSDILTYKNGQLINRKTYDMKGILRLERDFPVEKGVGR